MLNTEIVDEYLVPLTTEQSQNIRALRQLLEDCSPGLTEEICTGKWYTGLLTYSRPNADFTIYALGPLSKGFTTFHMMPYYASADLQSKHGAALKPFLSGKSCIKFKRFADLPIDALRDIIVGGAESFARAKAELAASRK